MKTGRVILKISTLFTLLASSSYGANVVCYDPTVKNKGCGGWRDGSGQSSAVVWSDDGDCHGKFPLSTPPWAPTKIFNHPECKIVTPADKIKAEAEAKEAAEAAKAAKKTNSTIAATSSKGTAPVTATVSPKSSAPVSASVAPKVTSTLMPPKAATPIAAPAAPRVVQAPAAPRVVQAPVTPKIAAPTPVTKAQPNVPQNPGAHKK